MIQKCTFGGQPSAYNLPNNFRVNKQTWKLFQCTIDESIKGAASLRRYGITFDGNIDVMYPFYFQNNLVTYVIFLVDFSWQVANNVKHLTLKMKMEKWNKKNFYRRFWNRFRGQIRIMFSKAATAAAHLQAWIFDLEKVFFSYSYTRFRWVSG